MSKRIVALLMVVLSLLMFLAAPAMAETAKTEAPAVLAVYNGTETPEENVRLRIVTTDGEKLLDGMVVTVSEHPTVFQVLKAGLDAAGIPLELVDEATPDKMFVNGIADLKSENPNFWMYYINQQMAPLGIGTQEVKDKDVVEFIFGDYNLGYVEVK